jgi:hypothetical protein
MWRWWQEYRMGYKPKGAQADALWLGIGVHEALAVYYQKGRRRGRHPAITFRDWAGEETAYARTYLDDTFDAPVWEDATELGIAMLEGYIDHWGKDPQWEIIAPEYPFKVRIHRNGEPIAIFSSRWDGVLRDLNDNQIYLLESKTAAQIVTAYLEIDDQGGSYWAVASQVLRAKGVLRPNENIAGIIYNFMRKAMPDDRPKNEDGLYLNQNGSISKKQPPPRYIREVIERTPLEQQTQLERIADEVAVMNAVRDGTIPVTKTPTKDCPRCPFFTPCVLHERGRESYQTILRNNYIQADPYEDMRKSA